jgi:hypothetical protein
MKSMKISAFRCCFSFLLCGFKQKFFSFKREKFFSFICPRKADVRKSRSGLQIRKVPAKSKITKTQSKKSRNQQEKTSAPAFRIFLVRTFPYSWTETRAVRQGVRRSRCPPPGQSPPPGGGLCPDTRFAVRQSRVPPGQSPPPGCSTKSIPGGADEHPGGAVRFKNSFSFLVWPGPWPASHIFGERGIRTLGTNRARTTD